LNFAVQFKTFVIIKTTSKYMPAAETYKPVHTQSGTKYVTLL